jgi:MFS-type transporter involved in bile tolerance (Atg22 family)
VDRLRIVVNEFSREKKELCNRSRRVGKNCLKLYESGRNYQTLSSFLALGSYSAIVRLLLTFLPFKDERLEETDIGGSISIFLTGFATLTSTAMLFAKTTLDLPTSSLISIAILTPLSGIGGSLLFPLLQSYHYLPRSNLSILILLIVLSTSIPLYGLISLENRLEIYLLSILFGIFYASFQSFSRTSFSELIPKSQAGRWFGLYSITDKSSSFLGPLLVSIITNQTGEVSKIKGSLSFLSRSLSLSLYLSLFSPFSSKPRKKRRC